MISLALAGSLLICAPGLEGAGDAPAAAPIEVLEGPARADEPPVIVALVAVEPLPPEPKLAVDEGLELPEREPMPAGGVRAVPAPPWSGAGRFVGGSVLLAAGLGLMSAAVLEFSSGRDTTQPLIGQVPAGLSMLIAGGIMIGTGTRDQHRLSEWEAGTRTQAKPMGTGLIVGGVTAITLGSLAAVATSIAAEMDLDAPRSIPAGWATAGVAIGGGTALLISGVVRRARYGKWRERVTGMPMVSPTRGGASVGVVGQF